MVAPATRRMPSRIGPYRVVARLASGGMAEVYLATMHGAAGFERAVVIKRSLPHLAHEPELRSTLLDEARIMSRIRHPNVVSVLELAEERDCFYLVMEHLSGECLAGLARALRDRKERLDPCLAVLIACELCAGLHSAHELTDVDGTPLHVVHRDVSPQNVFVTFDGEVKVLDFGIARYDGRAASRTRTGICKGKFAYMSPEQYAAEPFDRRADVFAVGVILHELLTGERLFARKSDVETLRAIVNDPYPTPRERAPDLEISCELESVVMKALARSPAERFATAEALRITLRKHLRELDRDHDARERLVQLARRVLPEKLAEAQDLVRRARETASSSASRRRRPHVPPPVPSRRALGRGTLDSDSPPKEAPGGEEPRREASPEDAETKAESPSSLATADGSSARDVIPLLTKEIELVVEAPSPPPRRPGRARALVIGAAAVGVAALGVAAAVLPRAIADVPVSQATQAMIAPTLTGAATIAPGSPTTAAPAHPATPGEPSRPPASIEPVAPRLPPRVRLHVEATPVGARVDVVGERCFAPCDLELARSTDALELKIEHIGFRTEVQSIVPEIDQRVVVRLVPEPRKPAAARTWRVRREPLVAEPVFYSFD